MSGPPGHHKWLSAPGAGGGGRQASDVMAWASGPPPLTNVGGWDGRTPERGGVGTHWVGLVSGGGPHRPGGWALDGGAGAVAAGGRARSRPGSPAGWVGMGWEW